MSYKQILTTNDIGTGENQIAAGNHNHDSIYVKKINFLDEGTDLNNILDSGFYKLQAGTNFPSEANYGQLINSNGYRDGTNDTILQICGSFTNKDFYIRGASLPITTTWHRITLDDDLNNVYIKKTGDTMSGNLITSRSDSNDAYFRATNSKGSIGLLTSTNRGLYDYTKSKWLIYTNGTKASTSYALYGAVWNDYAEFREGDTIDAGRCVVEVGNDTLITSTKRMMPGANITSDTFGFAIGETEQAKTPIAVSGRVLAYPYESREEFKKNIGRPVCSGPNGTVSIMTDEEYRDKGYCAIGTISAVPDYEEWGTGKVKVNGRVWIKVF